MRSVSQHAVDEILCCTHCGSATRPFRFWNSFLWREPALLSLLFQLSALPSRASWEMHHSDFLSKLKSSYLAPLFKSSLDFSFNPSSCFIFFIEFRLFEIMFYKVSLSTLLWKVYNVKMLPSCDSPVSQTMSYSVSFQKTADEWKKIRKNLL